MTTETVTKDWKQGICRGITLAGIFLLAGASACAANNPEDQVQRTFEKTLPLAANQGLSLDNRFGNVHVIAGSGRELQRQ